MFGIKNKKDTELSLNNSDEFYPTTETEEIPIHTMQDDLNKTEEQKNYSAELLPEKKEGIQKNPPTPPTNKMQYSDIYKSPQENTKSYSPFLNNVSAPFQEETIKEEATEKEKQIVLPEQPLSKNPLKWGKIISITASCIAFLAIAAGGYYFWITRQSQTSISLVTSPEINTSEETVSTTPVIIEPQPQKYSWEKPNYLSLDLENTTPQKIQEKIIEVASEIKEMGVDKPVEFIITDINNNPVDFSIFSAHTGIKFEAVANYLNDKFSFYIYPDSAGNRTALAINLDLKNKDADLEKVKIQMKNQEKLLVNNLSFLLLNNTLPKNTVLVFKDSQRQNYPIRYTNLDANGIGDLSLDYAFTENQLVISTSKNTCWAVLDLIHTQVTSKSD
ncbi:MAG: hypothetical protein QXF25_03180 [Candidatus Pacearchaeota archaeon]